MSSWGITYEVKPSTPQKEIDKINGVLTDYGFITGFNSQTRCKADSDTAFQDIYNALGMLSDRQTAGDYITSVFVFKMDSVNNMMELFKHMRETNPKLEEYNAITG